MRVCPHDPRDKCDTCHKEEQAVSKIKAIGSGGPLDDGAGVEGE